MNLQEKLEAIRKKPVHIRLRYTYFAVAISMFFVLLLWFFSIKTTFQKTDQFKKQTVFDGLETQKKSLEDASADFKKSFNDLNDNLEKATLENNEPLE